MRKNKVLIIAEAGVNHNGSYELAKQLIDAAADSKVDYIKFQTFVANKLVSKNAVKADYQSMNMVDSNLSQYEMLQKLEMPEWWHTELKSYAETKGIGFLSTGFDEDSIDLLEKIGIDLYKIPSGEITNRPYLEHVAAKGKPIILSTGMSTLAEIKEAIDVFIDAGMEKKSIIVLHCNTEYPTPMKDVNLLAMNEIRDEFGVKVGYSDHTLGIEVPIAAVAMGAVVIEKHFTIDRTLPGPDHLASLEPSELKEMVNAIRNIEKALSGSGTKVPSESEFKNIIAARKSIYLNKDLPAGHQISFEDIIMKRTGEGISPMKYRFVLGKKLIQDLHEGHMLNLSDFC